MIEIDLNKEINGAQFANELGIDQWDLLATEKTLIIKANILKDEAEKALEKHVPKPPKELTIEQKLVAAGISLNELKIALGL